MRAGFLSRVRVIKIVKWTSAMMVVVAVAAWWWSLTWSCRVPARGPFKLEIAPNGVLLAARRQGTHGHTHALWRTQPENTAFAESGKNYVHHIPAGAWMPLVIEVYMPFWLITGVFSMTTAGAWVLDRAARRRLIAEQCVACGYSRAGLATGAVCPECGTPQKSRE